MRGEPSDPMSKTGWWGFAIWQDDGAVLVGLHGRYDD